MATAAMNQNVVTPSTKSDDVYADGPHSKSVLRQTQALIGIVLLGGTAAAYFVNIAWVAVPVVVGLGLLFGGVSGVCPMAHLIARMPWNKPADGQPRAGSGGGCCGGRCG